MQEIQQNENQQGDYEASLLKAIKERRREIDELMINDEKT